MNSMQTCSQKPIISKLSASDTSISFFQIMTHLLFPEAHITTLTSRAPGTKSQIINELTQMNILYDEIVITDNKQKYIKSNNIVLINCIGGTKTNEYFFLQFEKVKAQELARKIHTYIWNESGYKDIQDAGTKDGIGYKRIGKPKFATLSTQRQRHFILHIGKKDRGMGQSIQQEIDEVIGRKFNRQNNEVEKYPHEAYIRLEWVNNFDQIKPYIDLAYNLR